MILPFLNTLAMIAVLIACYVGPPLAFAFLLPLNPTGYISLAYYAIGWIAALATVRAVGWWRKRHRESEAEEFARLRTKFYPKDTPCYETLSQLRSRK